MNQKRGNDVNLKVCKASWRIGHSSHWYLLTPSRYSASHCLCRAPSTEKDCQASLLTGKSWILKVASIVEFLRHPAHSVVFSVLPINDGWSSVKRVDSNSSTSCCLLGVFKSSGKLDCILLTSAFDTPRDESRRRVRIWCRHNDHGDEYPCSGLNAFTRSPQAAIACIAAFMKHVSPMLGRPLKALLLPTLGGPPIATGQVSSGCLQPFTCPLMDLPSLQPEVKDNLTK